MSLYHDTILSRIARADPKFKPLIPPSPHSRYTRSWSDKSRLYKWAARTLEVIRFTELLMEMGMRRKLSNKNRWRGIVLLEFIKCVKSIRVVWSWTESYCCCLQSNFTTSNIEGHPQASSDSTSPRTRLRSCKYPYPVGFIFAYINTF